MNEEELWDLSDDDLETAFKEAQASEQSPDTDEQFEESLPDNPEPSEEDTGTDGEDDKELSLDDGDTDEEEDGTEQPDEDEDSNRDSSANSDDEATTDEDSSDTTEEDATPEGDEPSSDDVDEDEEEAQPVPHKFKANGKDYEFTSKEIVEQFPRIFGQAMDYTKKMQNIKPWRKTIDALEGAELDHNDVSLMIDVLKGDKEAITEVLKRTGTDTLELDTETDSNYTAKNYGRDDSALAVKDIIDDIGQDVEYATTYNVLSKEWDDKSWQSMTENPEMIRLLHTDVKSGMYKTLQPIAEKLKVYGGGKQSDLDYYKEAAQEHFAKQAEQETVAQRKVERQAKLDEAAEAKARVAEVKAQSEKRNATKQASAKRKAAAPTKSGAAGRNVVDYLDDSDEDFDNWYKKLQDET
jgi:hypothetical protein